MESLTAEIISQTVESESVLGKSIDELHKLIRSYRVRFTYEEYMELLDKLSNILTGVKNVL